jgi:hypothetical protein
MKKAIFYGLVFVVSSLSNSPTAKAGKWTEFVEQCRKAAKKACEQAGKNWEQASKDMDELLGEKKNLLKGKLPDSLTVQEKSRLDQLERRIKRRFDEMKSYEDAAWGRIPERQQELDDAAADRKIKEVSNEYAEEARGLKTNDIQDRLRRLNEAQKSSQPGLETEIQLQKKALNKELISRKLKGQGPQ